jgi:peptide/nickel transport system permease protein
MATWLVRRALTAVVLVALASSAALLLARVAPGDVTGQLGPFASPSEVAATRARFDLDRSIPAQWALWASRAVQLDFGTSFLYNRPVRGLLVGAALNTSLLAGAALLVATVAGVGLGLVSGSRPHGWVAALVRTGSSVLLSLPPLLTSLGLLFVAARTGWLPTGGMTSVGVSQPGWAAWWLDVAAHLPLPTLALALPIAASFERQQARALADAVREPFLVAARARGVAPLAILLRHAWPVSLRPLCATYGVTVGALLSGSFVVEYVTAWPGLGRLMYDALRARDIYLVAGCATAGAACLAVGTLLGDVLLALVDPRAREALE